MSHLLTLDPAPAAPEPVDVAALPEDAEHIMTYPLALGEALRMLYCETLYSPRHGRPMPVAHPIRPASVHLSLNQDPAAEPLPELPTLPDAAAMERHIAELPDGVREKVIARLGRIVARCRALPAVRYALRD